MPLRWPRLVVADRDPLAEPIVIGALADPGGTSGRALLLIEAAMLARNMLKFELLVMEFGNQESSISGHTPCSLLTKLFYTEPAL